MIKNTFIFLKGISCKKEKHLWSQGISDWNIFIDCKKAKGISLRRKQIYNLSIKKAKQLLLENNSSYFCIILPKKYHWRLYNYFKDECAFLDIETSCVSGGYITCITIYDGFNTMTFVKGFNLDLQHVKEILSRYRMIVTFNGNVFDIPFLKKKYRDTIPKIPCWDLRHSCQSLGLKGSLKMVEKELGIKRQNKIVEKLHNGDPLKLWKTFLATGDKYYIELLVEYNQEDTINLKTIADKTYNLLCQKINPKDQQE
jgi:uncharacterized protein